MIKTLNGKVVSNAMKNTVIVEVFRKVPHPLYRKLLTRSKRYKVETEGKALNIGDLVKIVETKPISKNKYFRLLEVTQSIKEAKHE